MSEDIGGLVETFELGKLELRAGDVLIVKVPVWAGASEIERMIGRLREVVPDDVKIVITDREVEFFVLRWSSLAALTEQVRRLEQVLG